MTAPRPTLAATGPRCPVCGELGRACGGPTDETVTDPIDLPTPTERSSAMAGEMTYEDAVTENGVKYRRKVRLKADAEPRNKSRRAPEAITSSSTSTPSSTSSTTRTAPSKTTARKGAAKKTAAKTAKKTTASE